MNNIGNGTICSAFSAKHSLFGRIRFGRTGVRDSRAQLTVLKELSWLNNYGHHVFAGSPNLGKTKWPVVLSTTGIPHVSKRYQPDPNLRYLKERTCYRIPLEKYQENTSCYYRWDKLYTDQPKQTNRFFTFSTDTYETSSIIFTATKGIVD